MKQRRGRPKPDPRAILDLTTRYETWLGEQTKVFQEDLDLKHVAMSDSPFPFLRATYYAWAHLWPIALPSEDAAPRVTAVGDLHMENFGTWRDLEGRLAWGVNDFDEAATLPFTNDLVRLAASAMLARRESKLEAKADDLAKAFLKSYARCLGGGPGGEAILFAEQHQRIGERVLGALVRPASFWKKKFEDGAAPQRLPTATCDKALRAALPDGVVDIQIRPRIAGVGSLGRERFVAVGEWNGGRVAREAKAMVPSAAVWAGTAPPPPPPNPSAFDHLRLNSIRSRDPYLHSSNGYVVRRLAPDTGKIEIRKMGRSLERRLAAMMGQEVANVHLATPGAARAILADLDTRPDGWLLEAASVMAKLMEDSHEAWEEEHPRKKGKQHRKRNSIGGRFPLSPPFLA